MDSKVGIVARDAPDQAPNELQVDRSSFSVARLTDPDDSPGYWLSRPVDERLRALEFLRMNIPMAIPTLPRELQKFLKLLGSHGVEYLLVGGYAVSIHGYVRATNNLDVWVRVSVDNASCDRRRLTGIRVRRGFTLARFVPGAR